MEKPKPGVDFINPYLGLDEANLKRTNSDIALADWELLRSIRVSQGTFTTTNNILIYKLCNECRKRNITDMSKHREFEALVAGCHIITDAEYQQLVANGTIGGTGGQGTDEQNERGGIAGESSTNTESPNRATLVS